MNKTVGLDIAKLNLFFMKPNNLTSLRRMSRVRLACHGFLRSKLTIFSIHTVLHPYSALSLMYRALGKTLPRPSLKHDFKDACERLDNLLINNYIKKSKHGHVLLAVRA